MIDAYRPDGVVSPPVAGDFPVEVVADREIEDDHVADERKFGCDRIQCRGDVRDDLDGTVVGGMKDCCDQQPLDDERSGVLWVELREPEVVARDGGVEDVTRADECANGRNSGCRGENPISASATVLAM